tara:strand:- start:200 stop:355 length:156 start_codon:yes stop_codon:yes gene_type:complete
VIQRLLDWIKKKLDRGDTPDYFRGNLSLEELFKKEREKAMQEHKDERMRDG